jgi:uncharacterized membrane protein YgdD (TMEM256/DUF423 family)
MLHASIPPDFAEREVRLISLALGHRSFVRRERTYCAEVRAWLFDFMIHPQFARKTAAIVGFCAVALGAFGAHMLRTYLDSLGTTQTWQTGVLYHLVHAGVLLVLSGWRPVPSWSFWLLLVGVIIFSGSLYLLAVTGFRWLGAITPLGGFAMLAGWFALCLKSSSE